MRVLEVQAITAFYEDIQALWDISFSVESGQLVAILGANGAGKTTTLKSISGLLEVVSGQIRFKGGVISGLPIHQVADLGIAMVPEGRQLFPHLDVQDNLLMGAYLRRTKERRERNLKQVYELFPRLEERKRQLAETLSGGEQQMLAIGRALMQDPELIMLDEPSLGLAPLLVREVFRVIQELHRQGCAILLVEQNVRQALRIAEYCYILENGRIVQEGTGAELEQDSRVREAYLGF
jgi:branched-chain amino acid transport system ATP-binding protein